MHKIAVLVDEPIAAWARENKLLCEYKVLMLKTSIKPERLKEIVETHPQVVLLSDFRHPKSDGWHFTRLWENHPFLFPIGVIGITNSLRDLDCLLSVVETLSPDPTPHDLHFAINNAAINAAHRHRKWCQAELTVRQVRQVNDQSRRAKGLPLISDSAWRQACLILCRASLEYGDDWEPEALDLLINTFAGEM